MAFSKTRALAADLFWKKPRETLVRTRAKLRLLRMRYSLNKKSTPPIAKLLGKHWQLLDWKPFMGNVRMQFAHPDPFNALNNCRNAFSAAGLHEIKTQLPNGSNRAILKSGKAAPEEVKQWVKRNEFSLSKKAIRQKEGTIESHFFFDAHERFVCGVHIGFVSPAKKGEPQQTLLWMDVAKAVNPKSLMALLAKVS